MVTQKPLIPTHNPTILESDPKNRIPWIMEIQCDTENLKITPQIELINYNFGPLHRWSVSNLTSVIISRLPNAVASAVLTLGTPRNNPCLIISRVHKKLERTSAADHDTVQTKAGKNPNSQHWICTELTRCPYQDQGPVVFRYVSGYREWTRLHKVNNQRTQESNPKFANLTPFWLMNMKKNSRTLNDNGVLN